MLRNIEGCELCEALDLRDGDQVGAASVAHQVLDAAFLPAAAHVGEERLEAVHTAEVHETLVLAAVVPLPDLDNRSLEIVVDGHARHAVPELERMSLSHE